jgi:hypothetical protein
MNNPRRALNEEITSMSRSWSLVAILLVPTSAAVAQRRPEPATWLPAARHAEAESKLTPEYPRQSKLPSDIPWHEERESGKFKGEIDRRFPVAMYTERHYDGWQLCLEDFAISGRSLSECKWEPLAVAVAEPYSFRGHKDGYNACRENLASLVKLNGEEKVRKEANRFYKPIGTWASWGRTRASMINDKRASGTSAELLRGPGPKPVVRPGT